MRQQPHVDAVRVEVVLARRQHAHQRELEELIKAHRAAVRRLRLASAANAEAGRGGMVRERWQHGDVVGGEAAQLLPRARGDSVIPKAGHEIAIGVAPAHEAVGVDGPAVVDDGVEDDGDEGANASVLQRRGHRAAGHCLKGSRL